MERKPILKLFGMWASPYVYRVQLALKLKGLEYEYIKEDLENKSPELLSYNPIYKKVPVLVHDGRPLSESAVILEYIDEVWGDRYPLFPRDPYERAVVRFWHHFVVDKLNPLMRRVLKTAGEEQKGSVEEFRKALQFLEDEMRDGFYKGRRFFGGDRIGALDILFGCMSVFYVMLGEVAEDKLIDPDASPHLWAWFQNFSELELVKEIVPETEKLLERAKSIRAKVLPNVIADVSPKV